MLFRFADCMLDTDRRELERGARSIPLGPQVFDLLLYLLQNRERVVSKSDLFSEIWKGRTVSESTLTSHINAVRKAVGDTGAEQRLIRTIARKGFRFVGDVGSSAQAANDELDTRSPISVPADRPSIAVLPFLNLSDDPTQEYFTDGVVEDIITGLSRIKWLFVIARNSSFTYKGRAVDIKQVGRELGVRYVLEGSVRKAAGNVRLTGQLIDPSTGAHIWAERFDGSLEDIFRLQDQVTTSVLGAITPNLSGRKSNEPNRSLQKISTRMITICVAWRTFISAAGTPRAMLSRCSRARLSSTQILPRPTEWPHGVTSGERTMDGCSTVLGKGPKARNWLGGPWSLVGMTSLRWQGADTHCVFSAASSTAALLSSNGHCVSIQTSPQPGCSAACFEISPARQTLRSSIWPERCASVRWILLCITCKLGQGWRIFSRAALTMHATGQGEHCARSRSTCPLWPLSLPATRSPGRMKKAQRAKMHLCQIDPAFCISRFTSEFFSAPSILHCGRRACVRQGCRNDEKGIVSGRSMYRTFRATIHSLLCAIGLIYAASCMPPLFALAS